MKRRRFLRNTTPIGFGIALGMVRPRLMACSTPASDKVVIGVIGTGGRGMFLTELFCRRPDIEVAYVCDVDQGRLQKAVSTTEGFQGKRPKAVEDFRRILEDQNVHAVVNATPEHWHGVSTVFACQAGKDVYVEKPASHNIWEGRKMVEAARKYKRVVQVGTQTRSAPYAQSALALIRSGKLGGIHLVRVLNMLLDRGPIWKKPDPPVPEGLDWDMWVGPGPFRPYNPIFMSRHLWDFEGGNINNNGVHQLDLARWVIGKSYPQSVHHSGGNFYFNDDAETPDTQVITYEYSGLTLAFELTEWTPYMKKIPQYIRDGTQLPEWYPFIGTKIELYGSEGMMILGRVGGGWQVYSRDGEKGPMDKSTHTQMQIDHVANFVDCIRSREKPRADIEEGHVSAALCHMANISCRLGNRKLKFNSTTESFDDAQANSYLKRTYRQPWIIPDQI